MSQVPRLCINHETWWRLLDAAWAAEQPVAEWFRERLFLDPGVEIAIEVTDGPDPAKLAAWQERSRAAYFERIAASPNLTP